MKICPKCGKTLPDEAAFCMDCGADVRVVTAEVVTKDTRPRLNVMAIVGAALCFTGLPGAIISGVALKSATYDKYKVPLRPAALAGLILGICFTLFWTAYIVFFGTMFGVLFSKIFEEISHYA